MNLVPVPFHDDTLWAGEEGGVVHVAVKAICDSLGVAWNAQFERIQRDAILSEGVRVIRIPSPGGAQETVCLPLPLLPGFLFGIDDRRVKDPAAREKVLAYKRECYEVLFRHFFAPAASPQPEPVPEPAPGDGPTVALNAKVAAVREYRSLFGPVRARALWRTLGLPEPDRVTIATSDAEDAGARAHLLAASVPDGRTLAEAIAAVRAGEAETGRYLTRECWLTIAPEGLWLAYQCPFAIEAFAGTPWDNGGWRDAFRRLPGRLPGKVRAFGRYRAQSLHVPVGNAII